MANNFNNKTMYRLKFSSQFYRAFNKLIKKDKALEKRIVKALDLLRQNPRHASLKSHKVQTGNYGPRWSSRATGDIRIIWDFDETNNLIIMVLTIGGHSGKKKVYKK